MLVSTIHEKHNYFKLKEFIDINNIKTKPYFIENKFSKSLVEDFKGRNIINETSSTQRELDWNNPQY